MTNSFLPIFSTLKAARWLIVGCMVSFMSPVLAATASHPAERIVVVDSPVRGTIRSANGETLPGVSVLVKGTLNGTTTDASGQFTLNTPDNAVLVFSYIGHVTQEVPRNGRSTVDITLNTDTKTLDEVVVVGFGRQSRETVTTSISKLDTRVLENVPFTNAASALQGTVSGVRVQSVSGQPGSAPRILIRGGTSINNPNGASPLYIIDGVIRTNMNDISPDDIESLQVLKDAAATAIYGSRGSNGVIILTTKSGKAGKTRITYGYDFTVGQTGKRYEFADARQYIEIGRLGLLAASPKVPTALLRRTLPNGMGTGNDLTNNTAFTTQYLTDDNKYKLNEGWESVPDPLDPTKTIIFKNTDFQDVLFQTSTVHNNHIALSGGNDKATFNAGLGYLTGTGTVITTRYNRLTFNMNGDLKVRDNLSVFGRVLYTNSISNLVFNEGDIFARSIGTPNSAKYTFEDGTLAPGQARSIGNPAYHLPNRNDESNSENITLSTGARWELLPGLTFEPSASLYRVNDASRTFLPAYQNGAGPGNLNTTRQATVANSKWTQTQVDAVLTYLHSFGGAHNLEAKAGYSYFKRNISTFNATGQGAATDLVPTLNASSTYPVVSSTISDQLILGYFGRINYDYRQKYLLTINARYDGASNLGTQNRWGFFPGISAGWNLHQEDFWLPFANVASRLKLRGSYGINGNISGLSDFQAQGEYGIPTTAGQQRYNGITGIQQTLLPNADLQWERSKTLGVGADLGFLNNRISVLFDVYRRVTDDLLTTLTLPQSTGVASIFTNLGSLENKGVEFELAAQVTKPTAALQWNVAFNASKVKHKVLKLPPSGAEGNRVGGIQVWDAASKTYIWVPANNGLIEGGRIGDLYAYKALGVYATDEQAKSAPIDNVIPGDKTKRGGDVIWQDTDGDGDIDDKDRVYVGNQFPTWTGGFTNTLSYKNFSFLARLDFTTGHTIYNYARAFFDGNFQGDVNMTKEMADKSWKKQGDITDVPRYYWQDQSVHNFWRGGPDASFNSNYGEKGDFLCIREVTLSYVFPSALLQRVKLANLRLNLTGSNLYYFTAYKGLNPEDGGYSPFLNRRGDRGRFPLPRNITFGATISF